MFILEHDANSSCGRHLTRYNKHSVGCKNGQRTRYDTSGQLVSKGDEEKFNSSRNLEVCLWLIFHAKT